MAILSVQSHVACGRVGNRAAVFPLERLGFEVWCVNTVQFSNHPGYKTWKGEVLSARHVGLVLDGIAELGSLGECEALLSGYLGEAATGDAILEAVRRVKAANPECLYCCDPVMGDYGSGVYVRQGIAEFFQGPALAAADIVTPNQFEAELLSGVRILGEAEAREACRRIHERGPRLVLMKSFRPPRGPEGRLSMLVSDGGELFRISTPELALDPEPHGAGDLASALFLAHYLRTKSAREALEAMTDSVHTVLERCLAAKSRELRLVEAQEAIAHPGRRFPAERRFLD